MRKVTFGGANSLDNFIARKDHAFDWIMWSKEAADYMNRYWKTIDTILWGRKTYEVVAKGGGLTGYGKIKNYLFSRKLKKSSDPNVVLVSEDAGKFVRKLKKQKGKDICVMGGGILGQSLLEAGVIDEVGFCIHPVMLGSGIPLFHPMKHQINLKLLECSPYKNGCVLVRYKVKH
jgi:dihydrofolate reductase